ncbi:MAG TPA: O-antigen ligase family protein [Solirubrobacteraceae bacterium]|nr:O-antigen ligase family protein [Solirubrobacteraceae bacterium]
MALADAARAPGGPLDRSLIGRAAIASAACLLAAGIGALAGASPSQALGLVAVAAFLPIVVTRFTIGVGIFIISTFLGLSGTAQKGIGLVVIVVALGFLISDRSTPNFFADHKRLTLLILAYLAWCVVGLTWAQSTHDVTYSLERYIPNFLVYIVVYTAARDRLDIRLLAGFFVLGAAFAAGDAVLSPPPASAYADVSRVGGLFGDPNYFAAVLVTGFALAVALSQAKSLTTLGRAIAGVAAGLCLLGILLSVSRGGLIALGVALAAAVCLAGRWRGRLAAATIVVALAVIFYFFALAPPDARQRLTSSQGGGSGRTTIWKVGWREVQHHTVLGVGAGNFSVAGIPYVFEPGLIDHNAQGYTAYFVDTPTVAHNTYLEILAEEGIVGAAIFLLIILSSLECARRAALRFREAGDEEMELVSYGLLCGLLGFLAASFFLSEEYSKQLYLLLAMGPALLHVANTARVEVPVPAAIRRSARRRAVTAAAAPYAAG